MWTVTDFCHFELPGKGTNEAGRGRQRGLNTGTDGATAMHKEVGRERHGHIRIRNFCLDKIIAICTRNSLNKHSWLTKKEERRQFFRRRRTQGVYGWEDMDKLKTRGVFGGTLVGGPNRYCRRSPNNSQILIYRPRTVWGCPLGGSALVWWHTHIVSGPILPSPNLILSLGSN